MANDPPWLTAMLAEWAKPMNLQPTPIVMSPGILAEYDALAADQQPMAPIPAWFDSLRAEAAKPLDTGATPKEVPPVTLARWQAAAANEKLQGGWADDLSYAVSCLPKSPETTEADVARWNRIAGTVAYINARQSSARPMVPSEESAWRAKLESDIAGRYPHICPRCNGPAYVGAVEVDCAGGCK